MFGMTFASQRLNKSVFFIIVTPGGLEYAKFKDRSVGCIVGLSPRDFCFLTSIILKVFSDSSSL